MSPQNLSISNADSNGDPRDCSDIEGGGGGSSASNGGLEKCTNELLDVGRDSPPPPSTLSLKRAATSTPPTVDMRSNSIATLRIKAKEHLDNLNKGLVSMV